MKKMKAVIFVCIVLTIIFPVNAAEDEDMSGELTDDFFRAYIKLKPEMGTMLGLNEESGYKYDESGISTGTESEAYEIVNLAEEYLQKARSLPEVDQSIDSRTELKIFSSFLEGTVEGKKFISHDYRINHLFGVHYQLTNLFCEYSNISDEEDAVNYIARLSMVQNRLKEEINAVEVQAEKGFIPPSYLVKHYSGILKEVTDQNWRNNSFFTSFQMKLNNIDIDPDRKRKLLKKCRRIIRKEVLPEYRNLGRKLNDIAEKAGEDAGVWKLPDGEEYYRYCLKVHTTTDIPPDTIHQMGLKEVQRIHEEMVKLYKEMGLEGESLSELQVQYRESVEKSDKEQFFFPEEEESDAKVIDSYRAILKETEEKLPELFSLLPETPVTVNPIPVHLRMSTGANYQSAKLDGSRDAAFFVNPEWHPFKPGMRTLLHHETVPGHHLQIALEQELSGKNMYRHLTHFTGFIEGWALYAEKAAYEAGWMKNDHERLGYLGSELFRAARLVVDTGIHYKKWTRQQASDYMLKNVGWPAWGEIDRYILWPGQACAYKVGELKIVELRDKAMKELGNAFDIRDFHREVLKNGAVPLNLLEKQINNWILQTSKK